ncbi:hypothetical protein PO124_01725 [Bacillus licheniformis]|nr:hypothetical protein [Bacillus licheniformis]
MALSAQIPAEYVEEKERYPMLSGSYEPIKSCRKSRLMFREVFGYHYKEISSIIGKSEANCRQIHSRLKQKLNEDISVFHSRLKNSNWPSCLSNQRKQVI